MDGLREREAALTRQLAALRRRREALSGDAADAAAEAASASW